MDNKTKVLNFITEKTAELKRLKRSSTAIRFFDIAPKCGITGKESTEAVQQLQNEGKVSPTNIVKSVAYVQLRR